MSLFWHKKLAPREGNPPEAPLEHRSMLRWKFVEIPHVSERDLIRLTF